MLVTHSQIPLVSLSSSFHEATVRAVLSGSPVAHFSVEFASFVLVWCVPGEQPPMHSGLILVPKFWHGGSSQVPDGHEMLAQLEHCVLPADSV